VPRKKIKQATMRLVRQRAKHLCEYCHTAERWQHIAFTMDHIIPVTSGGISEESNLALACFYCNRRKSNKITGIDPENNKFVFLFHPRQHQWEQHFIWSSDGVRIIGISSIGRATVSLFNFNRERVLKIRAADIVINRHPPSGDPISTKA